jgi:hypothetical protein
MAAPTTLCTLAEVKARLQLPAADDADQDPVLDALRAGVEESILALTGYTFAGGTKTEQQTNVQLGVSRVMRYRPVLSLTKILARSLASDTFNAILGDLVDPETGRVMPLASELTPVFPPVGGLAPWMRWRQMIWPVVRFTYVVDPLGSETNPVPQALNRAAVEWTAFAYSKPSGGAVASWTVEKVSETYIKNSKPDVVSMLLGRHVREQASMVF